MPPLAVVVHVSARAHSGLPALFTEMCRLPCVEGLDKADLRPGTVTFAPPGYHMLVEADLTVSLSLDPPVSWSRPSIDVLFESASWALRDRVLGILLSGAND